MTTAHAHAKTQGLAEYSAYVALAHKKVLAGVVKGGLTILETIEIRTDLDNALSALYVWESKLQKLDKDSPCLKCKKIGG